MDHSENGSTNFSEQNKEPKFLTVQAQLQSSDLSFFWRLPTKVTFSKVTLASRKPTVRGDAMAPPGRYVRMPHRRPLPVALKSM